jgi:hypothetical protein
MKHRVGSFAGLLGLLLGGIEVPMAAGQGGAPAPTNTVTPATHVAPTNAATHAPTPPPAAVPPARVAKPTPRRGAEAADAEFLRSKSVAEKLYDLLIAERLSAGGRITSFRLKETERPHDPEQTLTFLGHLNELQAQQDHSVRPVVQYKLCRYLAIEYTEDEVAARTQNYSDGPNEGPSDGTVSMSGPVYTVTLRLPIKNTVTPFVGFGYAPWTAEFEYAPWWHLGWPSPEAYAAAGSPGTSTGRVRHMVVEDDTSQVLTLGVALKLHRYAELEVMMRKVELTSEANFYAQSGGPRSLVRSGEFPMDHTSYGVALKVVF